MSDSVRPHRRQPTRLPCPWDSPSKNTGVGCHFLLQCRKVKSKSEVAQSCPTLSDPMDCSAPGSSVHGIFQARVLEWVAIALVVKNSPVNAGDIRDAGSIPGLGRSPGEGNGNPIFEKPNLQLDCQSCGRSETMNTMTFLSFTNILTLDFETLM